LAPVRAWQVVRTRPHGVARISCLEVDLAQSPAHDDVQLRYVPAHSDDTTLLMSQYGDWLAAFGPQAPARRSVLVVSRGNATEHIRTRYPNLPPIGHAGSLVLSANAAEVAVLRAVLKAGCLSVDRGFPTVADRHPWSEAARSVLERLTVDERWLYIPAGKNDFRVASQPSAVVDIVAPMNPNACLLVQHATDTNCAASFNGGFFLWVEEETGDPFSFALDPVGLCIVDGTVVGAPIYRRAAVLTSRRTHVRNVDEREYGLHATRIVLTDLSLDNYAIQLATGLVVHGPAFRRRELLKRFPGGATYLSSDINPTRGAAAGAAMFTRTWRARETTRSAVSTPPEDERIELTICGSAVVAMKEGGGTYIPANGFVLSLPANYPAVPHVDALGTEPDSLRIRQHVDAGDEALAPESGLQVGPRVLRGGEPVDVLARIAAVDEEYVPIDRDDREPGIPPVYVFANRHVDPGISRLVLGVRPNGTCLVAMFEGSEPRSFAESDSVGASLAEVVEFLRHNGCHDAVALDGGGSAGMTFGGRPITRPSDRNDILFLPAPRLIPGSWLVLT
jgi:hypothetical protein